jgi:replicative DNA helicase
MQEISRGVAALAREIHLPILLTLQLSRRRRDTHPLITEREELLVASRFADMLLFIHRDPVLRDRAEIIVAKNRKGPTGTIPILFRGEFLRFQDHVPDPDGTEGS